MSLRNSGRQREGPAACAVAIMILILFVSVQAQTSKQTNVVCYETEPGCTGAKNVTTVKGFEFKNITLATKMMTGIDNLMFVCTHMNLVDEINFSVSGTFFRTSTGCDICSQEKCQGDKELDDYYKSAGISTKSSTSCSCITEKINLKTMILDGEVWTKAELTGTKQGSKRKDIVGDRWPVLNTELNEDYVEGESENSKTKRQSSVSIIFDIPTVRVISNDYAGLSVSWHKGPLARIYNCGATDCTQTLNSTWMEETDILFVRVYKNSVFLISDDIEIIGQKVCSMSDCVLCKEFPNDFRCLPELHKDLYIGLLVGIIVLGVIVIGLLVHSILKCLEIKNISNITNMSFKMKEKDNVALACVMLLLIPSFIPIASACDDTFSITSETIVCTRTTTTETCRISMDFMFNLFHPGHKICYDILNKDQTAKMGSLTVRYVEAQLVNSLEHDYWTSNWQPAYFSRKICRWGQYCDSNQDCSTNFASSPVTMNGAIFGHSTLRPGVSVCEDSCGCAGCDCISCSTACTYGRWAIDPVPSRWSVYNPGMTDLKPVVEICITKTGGPLNCFLRTFNTPGIREPLDGEFSAMMLSSDRPAISFSDLKVVATEFAGSADFLAASEVGFPEAGRIGDIQANTVSAFDNPTAYSFIYAKDMVETYMTSSQLKFNFAASGVGQTISNNLPQVLNGILWSYSGDNTLRGVHPSPGTLVMTLRTEVNQGMVFTRTITEVCPDLKSPKTSGFFSSSRGAHVTLEAKSLCLPGSCILSTKADYITMLTTSLTLTGTYEEKTVQFRSSIPNVDFIIICTAGNHVAEIRVTEKLDQDMRVEDYVPGTEVGGIGLFDKWFGDLELGPKIGFIIGIVAAFVILVGALSLTAWYLSFKAKDMTYQMVKDVVDLTDEGEVSDYN